MTDKAFNILASSLILSFLVLLGLAAILVLGKAGEKGNDVATAVAGDYQIIEIETHGEKHEYLYYHQLYRGSVGHLPNCKYCRERESK